MRDLEDEEKTARGLTPFLNGTDDEQNDLQEEESGSVLQVKWGVMRNCMYKYSKRAQDRFFTYIFETYFFIRFARSEAALKYILNKTDMCKEKAPIIKAEIKTLVRDATEAFERMASSEENMLSPEFTQRLLRDVQKWAAPQEGMLTK